MLHSIKLCSDKLSDLPTTPSDLKAVALSSSPHPVPLLVPASPVAVVNANPNVSDSNNLNRVIPNTSKIGPIVNNSNINKGIVHRQLYEYQGKYEESANSAKFHPYLRQGSVVGSSPAAVGAASAIAAATLFPVFQNSVNSNSAANKAQPATTFVIPLNATTSPSGLLTLATKQPTLSSTANSNDATVFINSNSSYANVNYTAQKMKSEIMSEGEETYDSQHHTKEICSIGEELTETKNINKPLIERSNRNSGSVAVDCELAKDQPDPDNIKMFVGQIPKSWDELQLRKMFEQYGRVHNLNVLRDKVTSMSRERKLFVGMLNKKYNEADVRQLFTGHGIVEECTVLRDQNGQSKGCAFVTFATKHNAIGAIKALHQSRTMEGCSAPLVVKFADTQKEKDQKKIQQLQHSIVGITALTTSATGGIVGLAPTTANGLSPATALMPSPLTAASIRSNSSMSAALAAVSNPIVPTTAAMSIQPSLLTAGGSPQQTSPYQTNTDAMNASAAQLQLFHQLQVFGLHPTQYLQGLNFTPDHSVTTTSLSPAASNTTHASVGATDASSQSHNTVGSGLLSTRSISMQNLVTLATLGGHNYSQTQSLQPHRHVIQSQQQHYQQPSGGITYTSGQSLSASTQAHGHMAHLLQTPIPMVAPSLTGTTSNTLWPRGESFTSPYASTLNPMSNGTSFAAAVSPLSTTALRAAAVGVAGKQVEGPDGSNLFIYHLPQEFTDTDLASTFVPFGNVLSAKVFIDKQTNLSKCFGFVSYDNPHSASAAIQAMHGFQIGTKRLKVQLKRSKDAAKPY
ncbi:CUGBP Elav-like family member 1 isoform X2 [Eurosta solidaginis]|uniref:CUGBP Elav-like family member 1 isoform X2 n=1 Tax=Eurosta solidaginis TaxID=178769 RepID=UPI003531637E